MRQKLIAYSGFYDFVAPISCRVMAPTEAVIRQHKLHELKKKAVLYYQANGVPEKIEEVLNGMFYDDPQDVFGYLSDFFLKNSGLARLSRIACSKMLDSRGVPTLEVDVFCNYQNNEQLFAHVAWPNEVWTVEHSRPDEKEAEEAERARFLEAATALLEAELAPLLTDECATLEDSRRADRLLSEKLAKLEEAAEAAREAEASQTGEEEKKETPRDTGSRKGKSPKGGKKGAKEVVILPDEPREVLLPGCNAVGAASVALWLAGAETLHLPLYEHVRRLGPAAEPIRLPLPLVTLLYGGRASPGKASCVKEYMVAPKPHVPLDKAMFDMASAYRLLVKMQAAKSAPAAVLSNDVGALNANLERPELGLDMILEALGQLDVKDDYNFVLNLAGQEIFDFDKGKYEVITGQQKLPEDLTDFYADILNRYPQVIGIIDPLRKQEAEAWMKLAERVSERCLVVGDRVFHRPGRLLAEELSPAFKTSGWMTSLEQRTTISELMECAQKMRENENRLFLSTGVSSTNDTFVVDVAVGLQFDFLKIGAPCRGERIAKFQRLAAIFKELRASGRLADPLSEEAFRQFPKLEPLPPSETQSSAQMDAAAKEAPKKK